MRYTFVVNELGKRCSLAPGIVIRSGNALSLRAHQWYHASLIGENIIKFTDWMLHAWPITVRHDDLY